MKAFRFRLERVLEWRRTELEVEENKLKRLLAALAKLASDQAALESARDHAGRDLLGRPVLEGAELQSLDGYRTAVEIRCRQIARARLERELEIARQQAALLEARRRLRLLEKLKERRLAEWRYQAGRAEPVPPALQLDINSTPIQRGNA